MSQSQREKQVAEAEEMLGDSLQHTGFAKGLYFGRYLHQRLMPYPSSHPKPNVVEMVEQLESFCQSDVDPVAIDRDARIPDSVIRGLGDLGVLGACLPQDVGGRGLSQTDYCRLLEVLGGHCASTALFVNAHHSIGPRAIVLFGTPEQQAQYLPKLCTGEWISAFALTEPEAGSDAGNVQTTATPTPDGSGYKLNGQKRWITNGGISQVLTVMARTPVAGSTDSKVTAFLVTPDMPGFEVVEERMEKCGVRGTATSRLAFHDMFVPQENILGRPGKGLKVALTVLDFGRTTFGASCTGAAKYCLREARKHVKSRVQFGQTLSEFEMVKEKLAAMSAGVFAMEAATYQTAALIDSGDDDYMVETAMLKVFATEVLWRIIYDTFQLHGGLAYFTDRPWERVMRDHRIDQIGEGANDVLRAFVALVGMRDVGLELKGVADAFGNPLFNIGKLGGFAARQVGSLLSSPEVRVRSSALEHDAARLGKLVGSFGFAVKRLLAKYQEDVIDRQLHAGRIADAATELYVCGCVLNRLDTQLRDQSIDDPALGRDLQTGRYYLATAARRVRRYLAELWDNDDKATMAQADLVLRGR